MRLAAAVPWEQTVITFPNQSACQYSGHFVRDTIPLDYVGAACTGFVGASVGANARPFGMTQTFAADAAPTSAQPDSEFAGTEADVARLGLTRRLI